MNINEKVDVNGHTALHMAVKEMDVDRVNELLKHPGIDVNKSNVYGDSPFDTAYRSHDDAAATIIESLLAAQGYTALHMAVKQMKVDRVNELLKHPDIDVNKPNVYGHTPLHTAVTSHDDAASTIIKSLIAAPGIDVNACDKDGRTPTYFAALWGTMDTMRAITSAPGVDVNMSCLDGMNPWYLVSSCYGYSAFLQIIMDAPGFDINARNRYGLVPHNMPLDNPKLLKKLRKAIETKKS